MVKWGGSPFLSTPPDNPVSTKKQIVSAFILWHLFNLAIDGVPSTCMLQDNIQHSLARYVNLIGQWEGSLAFFAPSPDSLNLHLEAELEFTDGSKQHWRSPDWKKMTLAEKFLSCRAIKYYDNVRRDDRRDGWEPLAVWIARQYEGDGKKVRRIELSRHWVDLPPPESMSFNPLVDLPHDKVYTFYTKDFT